MLREKGRVKNFDGNVTLELKSEANESFRIRKIHVYNPATAYMTVNVERTIAAYIRVGGDRGNHAPFPLQDYGHAGLYNWLLEQGMFHPIPVPSGMTLSITGVAQAGSFVTLVYDVYDAGDVSPDEPNGPSSRQFEYINYGRASTTLADGDNQITVQQTSNQFPAFPYSKTVPAKHEIEILALSYGDWGFNTVSSTNQQISYNVRLDKGRETLFDDDRNGFPYIGVAPDATGENYGTGRSIAGDMSSVDYREPLVFDPPLKFPEGDELNVYVKTSVLTGSAVATVADSEVALVCRAVRA